MEIFAAVILVTWLLSKTVSAAKLDHSYAKQGLVSPRLEAKYGSKDKAAAKVAKYGFFDHLRDAWRDYWPRRTDALIAARDARAADGGGRVRLRDRVIAGRKAVMNRLAPKVEETGKPSVVEPKSQAVPSAVVPTIDFEPAVVSTATPTPEPTKPTRPESSPAAVTPEPTPPAPTNGGNPRMSAPTGEAVNYETTQAELDAMITDMRGQVDAATAALADLAKAKASVDAMQQTYQTTAVAAQSKLDHEAALGLDSTTLGHAGTVVDALPVNAVDGLYEQIEQTELLVKERLEQAATALSSLEAEQAHLVATYGDAHATVAGELGGDARFLDSGTGLKSPAQVGQDLRNMAARDQNAEYNRVMNDVAKDAMGIPADERGPFQGVRGRELPSDVHTANQR